jgi:hypothetical protein
MSQPGDFDREASEEVSSCGLVTTTIVAGGWSAEWLDTSR